jgi:hypothetical protein
MTVSELLEELGTVKGKANGYYKSYKELKDQEDALKAELQFKLKDLGTKTFKGDHYTASIAEKPTVIIKDEEALMGWLQNTPNVESDFYIGVKKTEFQTLAKQMLKESGELADGTEVEVRESLSIRSTK